MAGGVVDPLISTRVVASLTSLPRWRVYKCTTVLARRRALSTSHVLTFTTGVVAPSGKVDVGFHRMLRSVVAALAAHTVTLGALVGVIRNPFSKMWGGGKVDGVDFSKAARGHKSRAPLAPARYTTPGIAMTNKGSNSGRLDR